MRLTRLGIRDFRNLGEVALDLDAPFVVFHGDNGQGKTNLLEAIYLLATMKSFRARRNGELVAWGASESWISGSICADETTREFRLHVSPSKKSARIDGKSPSSLPEYFRGIRGVLFAPEHVDIVRGEPGHRRRFIDRAVFTTYPAFVDTARKFQRLLSQKAALLKSDSVDRNQLEILEDQLVQAGVNVAQYRQQMVEKLQEPFVRHHGEIAGSSNAELHYQSALGEGSREDMLEKYQALLEQHRSDELRRQLNLVGPQRDDLSVRVDSKPARSFGSQGQVRSIVLALKLAELQVAREQGGRPLFLLDDLSSELDADRRERLVQLLGELDVQCFVSTTDAGLLMNAIPAASRLFRVVSGTVEASDTRVQAVC